MPCRRLIILFSFLLLSALARSEELGPGLEHSEVKRSSINMHRLAATPESPVALKIIYNEGAYQDSQARQGYGGIRLPELMTAPQFQNVLGVVNGIVFRPASIGRGYETHGMLLAGEKIHTLPQYLGAGIQSFIIWDAVGRPHHLRLQLSACPRVLCKVAILASVPALSPSEAELITSAKSALELVQALQQIFPNLKLGFQSNMEISSGGEWSRCNPSAPNWKCERAPRTLLCFQADGTTAFYTTAPALVHDLAVALAPDCRFLYNLDGGGSTQMGIRALDQEFKMVDGRSGGYRQVEHYFGFSL
ncbi:MAG: hypothetical protein A2X86_11820 [Bdellovibrionales bacterium GWA2_49_15]|nr:MAG: hypothetical protein A2X86_11820 [Bdellovibrionales bacterium GWA2_49_15]HAZ12561.1 hypothetical protein [Bdellovibrionales bacterium]